MTQSPPSPALGSFGSDAPPDRLSRNMPFLLLWAAFGISAMGDHISEMAVLKWLNALDAPNLTQLQAMMQFTFFIPFFALGPLMGMLADRLPRRAIMIAADLIRVGIMLMFSYLLYIFAGSAVQEGTAHLEQMTPWQKLSAFMPLLFVGIFAAMFSPARVALLPTLVRPSQLVRANAMSSGLSVIASMIAVLIGGWLADNYAAIVAFRVDAATFFLSATLLFFIRPPKSETGRPPTRITLDALVQAIRYVMKHHRVAQLIGVAVVIWACGAAVRSTMPAMMRDVFERPEYIEISGLQARLGLGMLGGAVILTILGSSLRSELAISWSLVGMTGAIGLLAGLALFDDPTSLRYVVGAFRLWLGGDPGGDGLEAFTVLRMFDSMAWIKYHIGGVAVILAGTFAAGTLTGFNALMQRILPNRLRGRVFGLNSLCTTAGLLLTTGLLGVPDWGDIDAWIGIILLGIALVLAVTAILSIRIRLKSGRLPTHVQFWWNLNEFYCKFWFRFQRKGICTVPQEGPVIVVANHTCSIDPLLLTAGSPHRTIAFMMAREFYKLPLFGRLVRMIECIPVRRDGHETESTKAAMRHLKDGKVLGIFIEGRINAPDEEKTPKDGAALLASRTDATLVPAHISGTKYSPKVAPPFFWRHRAVVRYGKPIRPSEFFDNAKPGRDEIRRLTWHLFEHIQSLGEQHEEEA